MRPSFLAGDDDSVIQASLINSLTNSPERIKPLLAAVTLVEEMPNGCSMSSSRLKRKIKVRMWIDQTFVLAELVRT